MESSNSNGAELSTSASQLSEADSDLSSISRSGIATEVDSVGDSSAADLPSVAGPPLYPLDTSALHRRTRAALRHRR
jgi:hypothetical protein